MGWAQLSFTHKVKIIKIPQIISKFQNASQKRFKFSTFLLVSGDLWGADMQLQFHHCDFPQAAMEDGGANKGQSTNSYQ